jgi:hypothetical protein
MDFGMKEIRGFLPDYDDYRIYCDTVAFDGVVNPVDGVFYPGVSTAIPFETYEFIAAKLAEIEGTKVVVRTMFMRLSLLGMDAPHQAHTDAIMGKKSMMLYLNRPSDCRGGTAMVRHETGMYKNPVTDQEEMLWQRDTNNPDKWDITYLCEMESNKAFIFDADRMHRAEPVGGFGTNPINGRLVLTVFYDC